VTGTRVQRLRNALESALEPARLEIEDQSARHAGHAGAADGRGHFAVEVVSSRFVGLSTTARHRLVYDAVGDLMQTDIHALSIRARTPDEAAARST
jgi:BolA protein